MSLIYVWENNVLGMGRSKHSWVGHASMNIGDELDSLGNGVLADWDDHVSWVPAEVEGVGEKRKKGYAASSGGGRIPHVISDVEYETYWPDHVIHIPDGGRDLLKARATWTQIAIQPRATYKMLSRNCSDIVAKVMRAAGFRGSAWVKHNLIWTPINIRDYALAAGGRYLTMAEFEDVLDAANLEPDDFVDENNLPIGRTRDGRFTTLRGPTGPRHNPDKAFRK